MRFEVFDGVHGEVVLVVRAADGTEQCRVCMGSAEAARLADALNEVAAFTQRPGRCVREVVIR